MKNRNLSVFEAITEHLPWVGYRRTGQLDSRLVTILQVPQLLNGKDDLSPSLSPHLPLPLDAHLRVRVSFISPLL